LRKIILGLLFFIAAAALFADSQLPAYKGPINDPAGVLSPGAVSKLEAKALAYRDQTGSEIGVLIVPTIGNESIEDYAHDVFNAWGIGKKNKDNGVLFVVAIKERKARVEVGYGLEDKLTDLEAGRLVGRNSPMAQYFRQGDYAAGTGAVLDGIVQAIGGDYNPPKAKNGGGDNKGAFGFPLFIIFFIIIAILRRKKSTRRGFGGPFWGGFGGGFGGGSSGGGGGFTFGGGA
jgi:uncharacterized protein